MKIIALLNQKGGSGKTTSSINLGAGLAKLNQKILLIDLDPQAHLTYGLGLMAHELDKTVYSLLKGEAALKNILIQRDRLSVIPASIDLSGAELEFSGIAGKEFLLRDSLKGLRGFDFVFIDCPPALGILTLNALTTAQEIYIPVQTEFLALQGISNLLQTVAVVNKRLNKRLKVTGIIGTRYDQRKILNRQVIDRIRDHFGAKLFTTMIRECIALAEAPSFGKTIFENRPRLRSNGIATSHGAEDYLKLSQEVIERKKKP